MIKALEGLRILDMSHVIAGPMASYFLAQLGAEVIKIERPGGGEIMRARKSDTPGEMPTDFVSLNAGKRSLAIDIKHPEGARLIRLLVETSDIFIENFRPGAIAKYGLDYESLKAIKPGLIYCSISGYGQNGEWSGRGGYDSVIQALTGMAMVSGDSGETKPMKIGFPVVDIATGMLGALSILAAFIQKLLTGKGAHIDASMVQAALLLMYPHVTNYLTNGKTVERTGNRGYSNSPTSDTFACADGWLAIAANTPDQFKTTARILGLDELCTNDQLLDLSILNAPEDAFVVARDLDAVQRQFRDAFQMRPVLELEVELNALGVPASRVCTVEEFLDIALNKEQLDIPFMTLARGASGVKTAGLGFSFNEKAASHKQNTSELGGDAQAILKDVGVSDEALANLIDRGIVRIPEKIAVNADE